MDVYIVDTNLIFSSLLNIDSNISQFILFSSKYNVQLFAPKYLQIEIDRHRGKIKEISGFTDKEIDLLITRIYKHINFIDDELIPFNFYIEALRVVRDIDPDDVVFVALNNLMDKVLWTGDTALYKGLKAKGYDNVVMFPEIKYKYNI